MYKCDRPIVWCKNVDNGRISRFFGLFLYCADGGNDEELEKVMKGIEDHKRELDEKAKADTKSEKKKPAETKKDR